MIKIKFPLFTAVLIFFSVVSYSQGYFANSIQSSAAVRMLARDASLKADAVYYNPAGTIMMKEGFHFSLSYQPGFDKQTINNDYSYLHNSSYSSTNYSYLQPSLFLVYNDRKLSISGSFNMYSEGGYVQFEEGLPFMELATANLIPCLDTIQFPYDQANFAVPVDYKYGKFDFNKEAYYYGGQANLAYRLLKTISISYGVRFNSAYENYSGAKNGAELQMQYGSDEIWTNARNTINARAAQYGALADYYYAAEDSSLGDLYASNGTALSTRGRLYSDQKLKAKRKGNGWTHVVGLDLLLLKNKLNFGFKYEFRTKLTLTNETTNDFTMDYITDSSGVARRVAFLDNGDEARNDIPALLSGGFSFKPNDKLELAGGMRYYFYKDVNWSTREQDIEKNMIEYSIGAEYKAIDKLMISAGFMHNTSPVKESFQKNYSYHLAGNTIGFGAAYEVIDNFYIDLGCAYTKYKQGTNNFDYTFDNEPLMNVTETYNREIWYIGIGISYYVKTKYDIY